MQKFSIQYPVLLVIGKIIFSPEDQDAGKLYIFFFLNKVSNFIVNSQEKALRGNFSFYWNKAIAPDQDA